MSKVLEIISLIVVAATITASFYLYRLYQLVGLNIFNYLDASEILVSQFQLLIAFAYIIIEAFVFIIASTVITAHFFASDDIEEESLNSTSKTDIAKIDIATMAAQRTTIDWLHVPFITMPIGLILLALSWIMFAITFFFSPIKFPLIQTFAITSTAGIGIAVFNRFASKSFYKLYRSKYFSNRPLTNDIERIIKYIIVAEIIAAVFAFTNLLAQYRIQSAMIESSQINLSIELDNELIKTNDTLVYIGRTRNFIILYNKVKENTEVISSDKINRLIISPGTKSRLIPKSYLNNVSNKTKEVKR